MKGVFEIWRARARPTWLTGAVLATTLMGVAAAPPTWCGLGPTMAQAKNEKAEAAAQRAALPMAPVTAEQPQGKIALPEGTRVKLVLLDELKSNKLGKGDVVRYALREDLLGPNGQVLIPKGTPAVGVVNEAKGARSMGRKGKLEFTADSIGTATEAKIPLRSMQTVDGKSKTGTVVALSLLISPLGLFMKGKNITVERGEVIEAYIDATTLLESGAFEGMTRHEVDSIAREKAAPK